MDAQRRLADEPSRVIAGDQSARAIGSDQQPLSMAQTRAPALPIDSLHSDTTPHVGDESPCGPEHAIPPNVYGMADPYGTADKYDIIAVHPRAAEVLPARRRKCGTAPTEVGDVAARSRRKRVNDAPAGIVSDNPADTREAADVSCAMQCGAARPSRRRATASRSRKKIADNGSHEPCPAQPTDTRGVAQDREGAAASGSKTQLARDVISAIPADAADAPSLDDDDAYIPADPYGPADMFDAADMADIMRTVDDESVVADDESTASQATLKKQADMTEDELAAQLLMSMNRRKTQKSREQQKYRQEQLGQGKEGDVCIMDGKPYVICTCCKEWTKKQYMYPINGYYICRKALCISLTTARESKDLPPEGYIWYERRGGVTQCQRCGIHLKSNHEKVNGWYACGHMTCRTHFGKFSEKGPGEQKNPKSEHTRQIRKNVDKVAERDVSARHSDDEIQKMLPPASYGAQEMYDGVMYRVCFKCNKWSKKGKGIALERGKYCCCRKECQRTIVEYEVAFRPEIGYFFHPNQCASCGLNYLPGDPRTRIVNGYECCEWESCCRYLSSLEKLTKPPAIADIASASVLSIQDKLKLTEPPHISETNRNRQQDGCGSAESVASLRSKALPHHATAETSSTKPAFGSTTKVPPLSNQAAPTPLAAKEQRGHVARVTVSRSSVPYPDVVHRDEVYATYYGKRVTTPGGTSVPTTMHSSNVVLDAHEPTKSPAVMPETKRETSRPAPVVAPETKRETPPPPPTTSPGTKCETASPAPVVSEKTCNAAVESETQPPAHYRQANASRPKPNREQEGVRGPSLDSRSAPLVANHTSEENSEKTNDLPVPDVDEACADVKASAVSRTKRSRKSSEVAIIDDAPASLTAINAAPLKSPPKSEDVVQIVKESPANPPRKRVPNLFHGDPKSCFNVVQKQRYAPPPLTTNTDASSPVRTKQEVKEESPEDEVTAKMQRELDKNIPDGLDLAGGENVEVTHHGHVYLLCSVCESWTLKTRTNKRFEKYRVCHRPKCLNTCDDTLTKNAIAADVNMPECGYYEHRYEDGTHHCQSCGKVDKAFAAINGYRTCEQMICKLYALKLPEYQSDKWKDLRSGAESRFNVVDCSRGGSKKKQFAAASANSSVFAQTTKEATARPPAISQPSTNAAVIVSSGPPAAMPDAPTTSMSVPPKNVPASTALPPPGALRSDGFTGEARTRELQRLFNFAAESRMTAARFSRIVPILQRKVLACAAPFPQKSALIFTRDEFVRFVAFLEDLVVKNRAPPIHAKRLRITIDPKSRPLPDFGYVLNGIVSEERMCTVPPGNMQSFAWAFLKQHKMWGIREREMDYVVCRAEPLTPLANARPVDIDNTFLTVNDIVYAMSSATDNWSVHCVLLFRSFPVPPSQHRSRVGFVLEDDAVVLPDAPEAGFVKTVEREVTSYKEFKEVLWSGRSELECDVCHEIGGPGSLRGHTSVLACTQWVCKKCKVAGAVPEEPKEALPTWLEESKVDQFLPHRKLVTAPPPHTFLPKSEMRQLINAPPPSTFASVDPPLNSFPPMAVSSSVFPPTPLPPPGDFPPITLPPPNALQMLALPSPITHTAVDVALPAQVMPPSPEGHLCGEPIPSASQSGIAAYGTQTTPKQPLDGTQLNIPANTLPWTDNHPVWETQMNDGWAGAPSPTDAMIGEGGGSTGVAGSHANNGMSAQFPSPTTDAGRNGLDNREPPFSYHGGTGFSAPVAAGGLPDAMGYDQGTWPGCGDRRDDSSDRDSGNADASNDRRDFLGGKGSPDSDQGGLQSGPSDQGGQRHGRSRDANEHWDSKGGKWDQRWWGEKRQGWKEWRDGNSRQAGWSQEKWDQSWDHKKHDWQHSHWDKKRQPKSWMHEGCSVRTHLSEDSNATDPSCASDRRSSPSPKRMRPSPQECAQCKCELSAWMRINGRFAESVCDKEACMARYENWRGEVKNASPVSDTHFFVRNDCMARLLGGKDAVVVRDDDVRKQNIRERDVISFRLLFVDGTARATDVRRLSPHR